MNSALECDVWSDFALTNQPAVDRADLLAAADSLLSSVASFPELDATRHRRPKLPFGICETLPVEAVAEVPREDPMSGVLLRNFMVNLRRTSLDHEERVRSLKAIEQYFLTRHALMVRLRKVRSGPGSLRSRLSAAFGFKFWADECGCVARLAPVHSNPHRQEKRNNAARREQAANAVRREQAAAEAKQLAELKAIKEEQQFTERCQRLLAGSDSEAILDFMCESQRFSAMVGIKATKAWNVPLRDFADALPPKVTWNVAAPSSLRADVRLAVESAYGARWTAGYKAHCAKEKRSLSALKAAATRKAKRDIEKAAERLVFLQAALAERQACLEETLSQRALGVASFVAFLAETPAARKLLSAQDGEEGAPIVLTDEEAACEAGRLQDIVNKKGIWRKDVLQRCPWISNSEIEALFKEGHITVLRFEQIRINGQDINARLYDPVKIAMLTREWVENWRKPAEMSKL